MEYWLAEVIASMHKKLNSNLPSCYLKHMSPANTALSDTHGDSDVQFPPKTMLRLSPAIIMTY